MTGEDEYVEVAGAEYSEELLRRLFHLKRYETPEVSRMTRNKQNIMRRVREASRNRRKSVGDLLEVNFPWFFAEPKYGVALLFVAFAGLQYLGVNARHAAQSNTGIYTSSNDRFAAYQRAAAASTNEAAHSEVPEDFRLFPDPHQDDVVTWASRWSK